MRDPLGFEVGSTPQSIVQRESASHQMQRLLTAYNHDLLLPGLHLVDRDQKVPEPIADDGKPLTLERRKEIAASRPPYDPEGNNDYRDLGPIDPIPFGVTTEQHVNKMIRIVRAKRLELPPLDGDILTRKA